MKRLFDILFSALGLIILSPVFLIIAILIKLTMPGSEFFSQIRVGQDGRLFRIYKFRFMVKNKENISISLEEDKRITLFGRWLRKSKVDEFPLLWNTLKIDKISVGSVVR
jgi:lipopolysaccharide/colanic/teichoic acid biosynthesis glycosyltransferase